MKWLKAAAGGVLILAAGLLATYATMRAGWWNTRYAAVSAKWAKPPHGAFVDIDGVHLHVDDQGQGPVVIMLHGSIVNLHEWDLVVDRLKARYRIIRIDWPPYGVTGPDPTGVYSNARAAQLLSDLVDRMGLKRFSLVATSNGSNVALEYAAKHPEHLNAMAFSVIPLERPSQTRKTNPLVKMVSDFHKAYLPDYHMKVFYRLIFKDTTPPGFHPPEPFVDSIYDSDNLPHAAVNQRAYLADTTHHFQTENVGAIAGKVHVPVLIQWCAYDTVISQSAASSAARFTHAPVRLIVYPHIGHFPMLENPDLFSADLSRFLDDAPYIAAVP